eukprot:TRINITY_DN5842_c0_g3_i3.p3 TRINITY_DN5842_c0_g3~~TRINITY_DN5842_c0_g3_i3.p3  ORF type:complete len:178 (+),score=44.30 TRINITY_DN5842_c0_g3_i3:230-763(+)
MITMMLVDTTWLMPPRLIIYMDTSTIITLIIIIPLICTPMPLIHNTCIMQRDTTTTIITQEKRRCMDMICMTSMHSRICITTIITTIMGTTITTNLRVTLIIIIIIIIITIVDVIITVYPETKAFQERTCVGDFCNFFRCNSWTLEIKTFKKCKLCKGRLYEWRWCRSAATYSKIYL